MTTEPWTDGDELPSDEVFTRWLEGLDPDVTDSEQFVRISQHERKLLGDALARRWGVTARTPEIEAPASTRNPKPLDGRTAPQPKRRKA